MEVQLLLVLQGKPSELATLGPSKAFRLWGGRLYDHPSGELLAHYKSSTWSTSEVGRSYYSVHCGSTVTCRFEGGLTASDEIQGPFSALHLTGSLMRASGHLVARYEEDVDMWISFLTRDRYKAIVLTGQPST